MENIRTNLAIHKCLVSLCFTCIALALVSCSSPAKKPSATHTPSVNNDTAPPEKTFKRSTPLKYSKGDQIVAIAESLIGSPYRYGGASPKGFDCSGLVYYTHQQLDITVPRTSRQQISGFGICQHSMRYSGGKNKRRGQLRRAG